MRRLRNVRETAAITGLMLAAAALAPPASASASAHTSAKTVTVKVIGIDRNGRQVAVQSTVTPLQGFGLQGFGPTWHLTPGRYFIGAPVLTATSDPSDPSQTLVARLVNVRKGGTIKLDARGGKQVSVWLDGKDLGAPTSAGRLHRRVPRWRQFGS